MNKAFIQPRIIRAKHAPSYLGMCRAEFDKAVRPHVREFPIGKQGVGFDRLELDAWADAYIEAHSIEKFNPYGRESREVLPLDPGLKGEALALRRKALPIVKATPHAASKAEFERVLEMVMGKKRK